MKTKLRNILAKFVCFTLFLCLVPAILPTIAFAYNTGDDYPDDYKNAVKDSVVDDWNFYNRECTSFVAWCLNSRNGISFHNRRTPGTNEKLPAGINEDQWGSRWGHAKEWANAARALGYAVDNIPAVGSVACWIPSNPDYTGHVAWVEAIIDGQVIIEEYNYGNTGNYNRRPISPDAPSYYLHIKDIGAAIDGHSPVNLGDQFFAYIRHQNKQVYLTQESNSVYGRAFSGNTDQVWAFYRQANGAYVIVNVSNNGCLDVLGASTEGGATVYTYTGGYQCIPNQEFYIYYMYDAYYFSPVHSGGNNMLDMSEATYMLELWGCGADWSPQEFDIFIIPSINGTYPFNAGTDFYSYIRQPSTNTYLTNQLNNIAGESFKGDSSQIWHFTRMANGSYVIRNEYNGACMDVYGASTTGGGNVYAYDGEYMNIANQRFYIYRMFNGYYFSPEHSNGNNMLDMSESTHNLEIWGTSNTEWTPQQFMIDSVQYVVHYDANGGIGAPPDQTKEYRQAITLSYVNPSHEGYNFLGWATSASATTPTYQPGDNYTTDANLNLYAVWDRIGNTITYNANGGETPPAEQFKPAGETITLSPDVPTRTGYTFLGWGTSASATTPSYQPGATYSADADLTLYALWRITNPPTLRGRNVTMLAGDTRDLADFVELTHDGVLSYTLTATAGGVVSLNGQRVTATAPGSGALIVSVAEYPAATCTVSINVVDLSAMLRLPAALTEIGNEAFESSGAVAVTVPSGCTTIGSRAFADNLDLVYVLIPASVTQIANDAFANSPNVTIYCYSGIAAAYAESHSIRYVLLSDDWVLADALPLGATVTDEQWTYQKATTETTTSTAASLAGWTQDGFTWQQTSSGTHTYAYFPEGFDTGHSLYSAYAKSALTNNETATTKRTVLTNDVKDYIYWHWTWFWGSSENKLISDCYCVEDGREYDNFKAYENGYIEYVSGQNYVNWDRGGAEDGSCWWFRFDVYRQTYADYQKLFTYTRTVTSEESSAVPVTEGNGVSNVQHWVKYTV